MEFAIRFEPEARGDAVDLEVFAKALVAGTAEQHGADVLVPADAHFKRTFEPHLTSTQSSIQDPDPASNK